MAKKQKQPRVMLLDADIVAYQAAAANEKRFDWEEDGNIVRDVDYDGTFKSADEIVESLANAIKADRIVICLTDPESNFRHSIYPQYKSNRKAVVRPELLREVKKYLAENYPSYTRPGLEADDIMGILATHPYLIPGEKVMVSEDKDMRTIPGKLYNPNRPKLGIIEISPLDANRFLCWQIICGDATDGYPGAPGVGKSSEYADEVIGAEAEELWDIVLDAYASVGLKEEDALVQAGCARILRWYDYDYENKKVIPFSPVEFLYGI